MALVRSVSFDRINHHLTLLPHCTCTFPYTPEQQRKGAGAGSGVKLSDVYKTRHGQVYCGSLVGIAAYIGRKLALA